MTLCRVHEAISKEAPASRESKRLAKITQLITRIQAWAGDLGAVGWLLMNDLPLACRGAGQADLGPAGGTAGPWQARGRSPVLTHATTGGRGPQLPGHLPAHPSH